MMLGINILLLNFIKYHYDVEPIYLDPFSFLAGKCSPASSGLQNPRYILGLVLKAKWAIRLTQLNTKLVAGVSFILSFVPALLNFTPLEVVLFGLPWSVVFAVSSYSTFSSYFWNMSYFFILCHFIKVSEIMCREVNPFIFKRG